MAPPSPGLRIPAFLNQTKADVNKLFEELEWHQRFRLQHALNNPATSPYRSVKSSIVSARNRYPNVQPWHENRIKLRETIDGSDYINASPISLASDSTISPSSGTTTKTAKRISATGSVGVVESKYIATQGPKRGQYSHFWNMVMHETVGDVAVIVMLAKCWEGSREKCGQYFPAALTDPAIDLGPTPGQPVLRESLGEQVSGSGSNGVNEKKGLQKGPNNSVTLVETYYDERTRCDVRRLQLKIGGNTKTVWHYLFGRWPDFGKPEDADRRALLELARQSRIKAGNTTQNPRFVHCSAGVGRTGTFIALDHLLQELALGKLELMSSASRPASSAGLGNRATPDGSEKGSIDGNFAASKETTPEAKSDMIYETVNKLREQRMLMVTTEIQFSFIYDVMREAYVEMYSPRPVSMVGTGRGELWNGSGTVDLEMGEPSPKISRTNKMLFVGPADAATHVDEEVKNQSESRNNLYDSDDGLSQSGLRRDQEPAGGTDPYAGVDPEVFRKLEGPARFE